MEIIKKVKIKYFGFSIPNWYRHSRNLTNEQTGILIKSIISFMECDRITIADAIVSERFEEIQDDLIYMRDRANNTSVKNTENAKKRWKIDTTAMQSQCERIYDRNANMNMNMNINENMNMNKNKIKKHKFGENQKVLLTDEEYLKLKNEFGVKLDFWIKTLDEGIALKGYKYKSHYLAIKKWSKNNINKESMSMEEKLKIAEGM